MSNLIAFPTFARNESAIESAIVVPSVPVIETPIVNHDIVETKAFINYKGENQELFQVENKEIFGPYGLIENKRGLFVNEKNINIVSNSYEVHQPIEIYQQFERVADTMGLTIGKVMSNPKNGGLMISAFYDGVKIQGENHDINLTMYTSHCGKYKTFLTLDLLRIACFNQVPCLYKNKDRHLVSEKHYKNALNIESLGSLLEFIPESVQAYNDNAGLLMDKYISEDYFISLFIDHYKMDKLAKQYDSKIEKAREIYNYAAGQRELDDNAYKCYQAITYMNTHETRTTAMQAENILTKGSDDSLKFLQRLLAA